MQSHHPYIVGVWLLGIAQIKWRCSSVLFGAEWRSGGLWAASSAELLTSPWQYALANSYNCYTSEIIEWLQLNHFVFASEF